VIMVKRTKDAKTGHPKEKQNFDEKKTEVEHLFSRFNETDKLGLSANLINALGTKDPAEMVSQAESILGRPLDQQESFRLTFLTKPIFRDMLTPVDPFGARTIVEVDSQKQKKDGAMLAEKPGPKAW